MSYNPTFSGSSSQTQTSYTNSSGSTIGATTPVAVNTGGTIVPVDVSNEATIESWVGLTLQAIPNTNAGVVVNGGRVLNISLGLGFAVGDAIWVGNTPGTLTNVKPDLTVIGWSPGYYVLFVGVVVKNAANPSLQDLQISRQIIGQL